MGFRVPWRTVALAAGLLAAAACAAQRPEPLAQRDLRAELAALPTPAGADASEFAQLKGALAALLDNQAVRTASVPPTKPQARVTDFSASSTQDQARFSWSYTNPGDFNRDGQVNISDLSTLGRFLGRTANLPNWDQARAADGNRDGVVSISDLSTLGGNLLSTVDGYHLRFTDTPAVADSWQVLATIALAEAQLDPVSGELVFEVVSALGEIPEPDAYFQVVPFHGTQLGIASNSDTLLEMPPAIAGVSPISGKSGQQVTFSTDAMGTAPLEYLWDFGGAATPNTSTAASPTVTLGAAGSYSGSLTVTNPLGSDDFQFVVVVSANQPPTVSLSAAPNAGPAPLVTVLTASANDPDGTVAKYEWDLDGNGSFETSTAAVPTATATLVQPGAHTLRVQVTDSDGATATASVTVTVAALPSAQISANVSQIIAPDWVTLDASGSSSPNGTIVKYEWDWDNNGTIDFDSKQSPFQRVMFDAPTGTWQPRVIVTDATGASNSATTTVVVSATKFVLPPVEQYQSLAPPNAPAAQRWLKNVYSTLPEWRDANGPYQSAYFTEWADRIFVLINAQRQLNGRAPVKRLRELDLLMQAHERDQALRSYFSHNTPDGLSYQDRLFAIMPPPTLDDWGEIVAQGQETPEEAVTQWMGSPGHRAIILEASLTHCGVGVYYKSNGQQGLESYTGVDFVGFKFQQDPPPGHNWLLPDEVP